jgi:hypothetical protein
LWDLKHPENPDRPMHRLPEVARRLDQQRLASQPGPLSASKEIHLPPPSYWPIVMAFGLTFILGGLVVSLAATGAGLLIFAVAVTGWIIEPVH